MDWILIEGDAAAAACIESALRHEAGTLLRVAEAHVAAGAFEPRADRTAHVLVGFDAPTPAKARAVARLWAGDGLPPCHLVTHADSPGEALLQAIFGDGLSALDSGLARPGRPGPQQARASRLRLRGVRSLALEHILALERVLAEQGLA